MNNSDQQLDRWLSDADQSLVRPGAAPTGDDIRRRSNQRQAVRLQRRRAATGAVVAILLLAGWRFLMPVVNQPPVVARNNEDGTGQLLAEVQELQRQRQLIDDRLTLLDSKSRMGRMEFAVARLAGSLHSPETTYQRNRNTWTTLRQIANWRQGEIPDSRRWQLEMLADGFPDTVAGSFAQTMLTTDRIPDSLYEKSNEL